MNIPPLQLTDEELDVLRALAEPIDHRRRRGERVGLLVRTGGLPPHRNEVSERGEKSREFDDKALSAE
jgi:hypothetical protein